jgi:hypothetical protein
VSGILENLRAESCASIFNAACLRKEKSLGSARRTSTDHPAFDHVGS